MANKRTKPPSNLAEFARTGRVERVEELLQAGAGPNEPETARHWSPLIEAAYGNWAEIAHLLLEAGADLYAKTNDGESVMAVAVEQESYDVIRALRDHDYRPEAERDNVVYLLSDGNLQPDIIDWLLNSGIDIDFENSHGWTALRWAAYTARTETVIALIRRGAYTGGTILYSALFCWPSDELITALLESGADAPASLVHAASGFAPSVVEQLLELGADPNAVDRDGHSVLFVAQAETKSVSAEIARILTDHGAVLNEFDQAEVSKSSSDWLRDHSKRN